MESAEDASATTAPPPYGVSTKYGVAAALTSGADAARVTVGVDKGDTAEPVLPAGKEQ